MGQYESPEDDRVFQNVAVDAEDPVQLAREVVNLFVRIFKTSVTLGKGDDPSLKGVQRDLLGKLQEYLHENSGFVLEIRPFEILWRGHLAYESRDPKDLPNLLHRGGLTGLTLNRGINDGELTAFFRFIKSFRDRKMQADDLWAVLPNEDFPHLDCSGTDDCIRVPPLPIPESLDDLRRQYPRSVMSRARQSRILPEYCPNSETDFLEPLPEGHRSKPSIFKNSNRLGLTVPQETDGIDGQMFNESASASECYGLEILMEVLLMEKSRKDFDKIVFYFLAILDRSLKAGDYQRATEVLGKLHTGFQMKSLDTWQRKRLRKAIFDGGTESRIRAIAESIKSSEKPDLVGLAEYLPLLQKNAVPHLCKLLGELKGSKPRRIICDALADLGKDSIDVFGAFWDDDRWFVARNIVYILGRIGKTDCLPYLEKALDHPDPRVRREAVRAISTAVSKETAIQHLTRKLNDMDSKTRGVAALRLARIGGEEALRPLLDLVLSKAFQKREVQEIKGFLQAIGTLRSDGAVPALFRILLKKSLFSKLKTDEIRKGAAEALGAIGTQEALTALGKVGVMGDDFAKEASIAVLKRIEQS